MNSLQVTHNENREEKQQLTQSSHWLGQSAAQNPSPKLPSRRSYGRSHTNMDKLSSPERDLMCLKTRQNVRFHQLGTQFVIEQRKQIWEDEVIIN